MCTGRSHGSYPECRMPSVPRGLVDEAAFEYFANLALDLEGTRVAMAGRIDHEQAELATRIETAEKELAEADAAITKVKRDYIGGALSGGGLQRRIPEDAVVRPLRFDRASGMVVGGEVRRIAIAGANVQASGRRRPASAARAPRPAGGR